MIFTFSAFYKHVLFSVLLVILIGFLFSCRKVDDTAPINPKTVSLNEMHSWHYASTPALFPESALVNDTKSGMNRAWLAWNNIDMGVFYDRGTGLRPANISREDISDDNVRIIYQAEIFPEIQTPNNFPVALNCLNLNYFPSERGTWNFDVLPNEYSCGLDADGKLINPQSRWGGIMSHIPVAISPQDTLVIWMMDPFTKDSAIHGKLYIDLGEISEDVLPDQFIEAESMLDGELGTSVWGKYTMNTQLSYNFPLEPKDFGLDGLDDQTERIQFAGYLGQVEQHCTSTASQSISADPSNDRYRYFLGEEYDAENTKVIGRYKSYNLTQGNSFPVSSNQVATLIPDMEDINRDGFLTTSNNYYEYTIDVDKAMFVSGHNFITEVRKPSESYIYLENGKQPSSSWYCLRIPLSSYNSIVGSVDGKTLNTIRLFLTGFSTPTVLRFALIEIHQF